MSSATPILAATRFKALKTREVQFAEFHGEPIVTVFDTASATGAAGTLSATRLESDFARWWDAVHLEYPGDLRSQLQIKFVALKKDESRLKQLCAKLGISPQAIATFDAHERLECFFYVDSGRLRIAPVAASPAVSGHSAKAKATVLIVDDSATIRRLLRRIINSSPYLEVIGEAERPSQVEALLETLKPDVMTLDINLPEMSGVELLKTLLPKRYIPTVMVSSLNIDEGREVLNALEIGAVDYIHKPAANEIAQFAPLIQEKLIEASRVRRKSHRRPERQAVVPSGITSSTFDSDAILAIGASTGGTEAIRRVFMGFPAEIPAILVVQHIPPYFSTAFANRLNELCPFEVREAQDGDEVRPGRVLIAPGGWHMEIRKEGAKHVVRVFDAAPVNRFKPSVDVLFDSVAKVCGSRATGLLMTGMGADGAKGLLAMKKAGALTIAQDEETCVVFGMPRAAIELGAATLVKGIDEIADACMLRKLAA